MIHTPAPTQACFRRLAVFIQAISINFTSCPHYVGCSVDTDSLLQRMHCALKDVRPLVGVTDD